MPATRITLTGTVTYSAPPIEATEPRLLVLLPLSEKTTDKLLEVYCWLSPSASHPEAGALAAISGDLELLEGEPPTLLNADFQAVEPRPR